MRVTTPKTPKQKPSVSPQHSRHSPLPTPLNKSQQKSTKSLSPAKKSPAKQSTHEELINKMQRNRQRLCNTLDTYTLLIRSNHPIRCLQHNSNISIYCETQQKLLCSNCIFSKLDHKYHKVVPVDKVHEKLQRDVEIMQRQIERQVQGIDQVYNRIFNHYQQQQQTAQEAMIKLEKLYQDARIMIDQCEVQAKRRIMLDLQRVQVKHQTLLAELNFLKNVYKDQYAQVQPINDANFLIYEHVMCNTVVNQGKFSHIKWKPPVNSLQKVQIDECKRIVCVLEMLDKYLAEKLRAK